MKKYFKFFICCFALSNFSILFANKTQFNDTKSEGNEVFLASIENLLKIYEKDMKKQNENFKNDKIITDNDKNLKFIFELIAKIQQDLEGKNLDTINISDDFLDLCQSIIKLTQEIMPGINSITSDIKDDLKKMKDLLQNCKTSYDIFLFTINLLDSLIFKNSLKSQLEQTPNNEILTKLNVEKLMNSIKPSANKLNTILEEDCYREFFAKIIKKSQGESSNIPAFFLLNTLEIYGNFLNDKTQNFTQNANELIRIIQNIKLNFQKILTDFNSETTKNNIPPIFQANFEAIKQTNYNVAEKFTSFEKKLSGLNKNVELYAKSIIQNFNSISSFKRDTTFVPITTSA